MRVILIATGILAVLITLILLYPVKKYSPNCDHSCSYFGVSKELANNITYCVGLPLPQTCKITCEGK